MVITTGRRRLIAAALLALLACGCQARLSIEVAVDRDGAGRLAISLGADQALLTEADRAGVDPLGDLAAVGAELERAGAWRVTDEVEADGRVVRLSAPFASPDELERLAEDLSEALAGPELVPLEGVRLDVTEEELRFSAVAGLVPTAEVTALGVQPEQAVTILEDTEALVYDLQVRLAGEVLDSNADGGAAEGVADQELTWRIEPGERIEAMAVSQRPRTPWLIVAAAAGAGLLLLVGLLVLSRSALRRRRA